MTDPNEALVEELAWTLWLSQAERAAPNVAKGRTLQSFRDDMNEVDRLVWLSQARAILPIIARVRDEALEEAALSADALNDYYASSFHAESIRALKGKP